MGTVTEVPTYQATIYCGLGHNGNIWTPDLGEYICQRYVNDVGLCITFTETKFIYNGGFEPGIIVGLINYPRDPTTPKLIRDRAIAIARKLKKKYRQKRVSIVCTDGTIMLGEIE